MTANELQIGDWVHYWILDRDAKINDIMNTGRLGIIFTDSKDEVGYIHGIMSESIKPIPITPKILEKNGFVKNKYGEMILDEELGTSEIYLVLEPSYDEEYYWWRVNNELIAKIKSIHELQHVLRLCNIEKEIEL